MKKAKPMRQAFVLSTITVLVIGLIGLVPSPATAQEGSTGLPVAPGEAGGGAPAPTPEAEVGALGANPCVLAPFGASCMNVQNGYDGNSQPLVSWLRSYRDKVDPQLICNWRAEIDINRPVPYAPASYTSPTFNRCDAVQAWYDWSSLYGSYPAGTQFCSRFYENGQQQGGSACAIVS